MNSSSVPSNSNVNLELERVAAALDKGKIQGQERLDCCAARPRSATFPTRSPSAHSRKG